MSAIDILIRDLRDAVRGMRQRPAFTALAVLTLALGIGVNVAAMAAAYGILLRPLPYPSSERIVILTLLFPDGGDLDFSPDEAGEWLRRLDGAEAAAAYYTRDVTVRTGSHSAVVRAAFATDRFFDVFGAAAPRMTRLASDDDSVWVGAGRVAEVLGGEKPRAVGTTVTIGDAPRTVAAVLSPEFGFPNEQIGIWLPWRVAPFEPGYAKIVARLKPGVTLAQFRDTAARVARDLRTDPGNAISITPLGESVIGGLRRLLLVAFAGSLLVLAVASANVATLFIGRDISRRREFATRLALGAGRADLVRRIFVELSVVAIAGAAAGLLLGQLALTRFAAAAGTTFPRLGQVRLDIAVGVATVVLVALAVVLSGSIPAWHAARADFTAFLKPSSSSRPAVWVVRRLLVVAQIACCCMLLVGAGLLIRTVTALLHEDAGFDGHQALSAKVALSDKVLAGSERSAFVRDLLDRTRALPGVRGAGLGSSLPPRTPPVSMSIAFENDGRRRSLMVNVGSATPGFLPALGARFIAGRDFQDADNQSPVVVLSASLARFSFPGLDPIGQKFVKLPSMFGVAGVPRVIGVVADVKYSGLDAPAGGALYLPWSSRPFGTGYLVARTASDPRRSLADVRQVIASIDPAVPVPELLTLDGIQAESIAARRMRAIPAAAFALLALAVAAVGVMATLSTLVAERRRDLAIRAALGASPERLMWTIGRQGLTLTAIGIIAGLGAGAIAGRGLSSLLYGVRPYDAATFGVTAAVVTLVSGLMTAACSSRALRIDPIAVLRQDA
ncbi:MAG TPA: ABC transporter permease [Vicinamibacterales bacterium]